MQKLPSLVVGLTTFALLAGCSTLNTDSQTKAAATHAMTSSAQTQTTYNMFGGAAYLGQPALPVTAALVKAGGGANHFSFAAALVSMLGEKTVNAEVAKLTQQYGKQAVHTFITGMDYAIKDGLKRATEAGVTLPEPADLEGVELAKTLVKAGTTPDGTFWSGHLFDKAISHALHNQVMDDINSNVSYEADMTTHKLLNQAMYDVAQALGMTEVKLASLH